MATNTEVAGISIGITADIGGLSSSLSTARQKIDSWMTSQQKKTVSMTVEAVKGQSWNSLEGDLNKLVEKVTSGHTIPINVEMAIEDAGKEKARLETIVKNQLGNIMLPIEVKYTTDITINSHVFVTWEWADGHGPPTTMGGGGGGGGDTGPTGPTRKRGRKAATTGGAETSTETEEPAPSTPPRRRRGATPAGEGGAVTVKPDKPKKAEAEKPAGGGIAAMPTATPQNAAKKAKEQTIADNTAKRQAEAGEQLAVAAKEWRDVTRNTFMRNLQRQMPGMQPLGVKPEMLEGATGFQAEYQGRTPTGAVAYVAPGGQRHRYFRSPTPRTFEGTTHGERPVEGRIVESRRGDPNDPRRGLADTRTMSWFDPAEGFVDPQVRAQGQKLFNEAMAVREKEVYESLKDVVEQRQGETEQDFAQRLMRDWTQQGWGFNKGKTLTTKASTLEGISEALKLSPAMGALDKLRTEGKFGEFFGDEASPGALKMRADMQSLIRARSVKEAQTRKGEPLTEQERKAALSKGTQRATRLRGEGLPVPGREEEALYVQLNAMIGQAFKDQFFAEQKLASAESGQQGAESTITNEMVAAFTQLEGERPVAKGTRLRQVAVPTGRLKEVIDRDKGLRKTGEPHPEHGMFETKVIPEMEMVQDQAGAFVKRLKDETNDQYESRVGELQQDWDQGLRDFAETFEMPAPGAERAPRPRKRQTVRGGGASVAETDLQKQIKGWNDELERMGDIGPGGEGFDQERYDWLEQTLADIEAGRMSGSRRTRVIPQERRITRAEGLVSESQRKLEAATDPAAQAYYQRQLGANRTRLATARRGTTAERGLTGPHRTASQQVRANIGFCEYCGKPLLPGGGHADHPISRAHGGGAAPMGGPEHLVASCPECNIAKGEQDILEWLQNKPEFAAVDPRQARAAQAAVRPERMWEQDVLGLKGSARRRPSIEAGFGGAPIDVPDVRDIAKAMGISEPRKGWGAGQRIKMTAGTRAKMQRAIKGSEIEKVFALIGDRYVDEAGRVLVDVSEAIQLETDPRRTGKQGFAVSTGGYKQLGARLEQTGKSLVGMTHGREGHTLLMSEPGKAAVKGQADTDVLRKLSQEIPGFISGIIDPLTKEGMRLYQQGAGGPVQRRYNIGRNIPRMATEPVEAQAAMPVSGAEASVAALFAGMSDGEKAAHVAQMMAVTNMVPDYAQGWANAQATGMTFTPMQTAGGGLAGLQQGFGLPGGGAMGPGVAAVPPRGQAAAAARAGAAPPPQQQWQQWGFFGQGGFVPPGGGAPVPPGGMGPPPGPAGGGMPPGQQPQFPYGQPSRFQRTTRDIREAAYTAGLSVAQVQGVISPHEIQGEARRETIGRIQGQIAEDIAKTPVRAFTTAIGQYVSNLVVRGEVGERRIQAGRFGRLAGRATAIAEEAGIQRDLQLRNLEIERQKVAPDPDKIAELESSVAFETERHADASKAADSWIDEFEKAGKGVAPLGVQMLNLGAITVSMLGAMIGFQAAMKIAQAAFDQLVKVTYDGVEAATGYNATLKRVQEELAKGALEGRDIQGAVARGFEAAGMEATPEQRAMLEGQVGAVVAMERATMQRDMLRVQENLRARAPGAQEFGIAPGLVQPTGGLFGTAIGATPSLDEIIGDEFERLAPGGPVGGFVAFDEGVRGFFDDLMGRPNTATLRTQAQTDYIDNFNKELASVGETATAALGRGDLAAAFTPEIGEQANLLDTLGATNLSAAVRAGAVEFQDANGKVITEVEHLAEIVKSAGKALEPTGREIYESLQSRRQRNAAFMGIEDRYTNAQRMARVSEFRRFAAQPMLPFGTTFNTGDAASMRAMAEFGPQVAPLRTDMNQRMAQGRAEMIRPIAEGGLGVNEQDVERLEGIGQAIAGINAELARRQLEVSSAAFAQNMMVAQRTVGDLIALTGDVGNAQATNVGIAMRENLELERGNTVIQRRMTLRSMEMQQAQINFNLAVSRFTTGGATPAEAAARGEQAEIEARFAQEQLNDQRTLFGREGTMIENQIQIVDETNLRALQDAVFNVGQLVREHDLEKYSAAAQETLGWLQAASDYFGAEVDNQIARGQSYVEVAQDEIRRIYVESGEILNGVVEDVGEAFAEIREDYEEWIASINEAGNPFSNEESTRSGQTSSDRRSPPPPPEYTDGGHTGTTGGGGGGTGDTLRAYGAFFNTTGTQDLTVGEAGKETVAILRNPRQMSWGGGGGGGAIVININDPVVRDNSDIEKIARAVEETLRQRSLLMRPQ